MQKKLNFEIVSFVLPIFAQLNDLTRGENKKKGMLNHFQIVGNKSTIWTKIFYKIHFIHLLRVLFCFSS